MPTPKLIFVPVRADVLERLRGLAQAPATVTPGDNSDLSTQLVTIGGCEQFWLTVELHESGRDLTVEQLGEVTLVTAELLAAGLTHLATTRARPSQAIASSTDVDEAAAARWPRLPAQLAHYVHRYDSLRPPLGVRDLDDMENQARCAAGMLILLGWSTWPDVFEPATVVSLWHRISRSGLLACRRDNLRVSAALWEQAAMHNFAPASVRTLPDGPDTRDALHAAAAWLLAHPAHLARCGETRCK